MDKMLDGFCQGLVMNFFDYFPAKLYKNLEIKPLKIFPSSNSSQPSPLGVQKIK